MSLRIDTAAVVRVMVSGRWFAIETGSFHLDSYEYIDGGDVIHSGGASGVCATGFVFTIKEGARMFGPITAIQAVAEAAPERPDPIMATIEAMEAR